MSSKRSKAEPLRLSEVASTTAVVLSVYGGGLFILHRYAAVSPALKATDQFQGYWKTLPSAWDHPEPNYVVSGAIGEFWSVLTTIPVAGALLLYQGLRFGYGPKVMSIYCLTCAMYSLAFTAHLTLQKLIFSTTVVAVMSNALLTFAMFSHVVHRALSSKFLRLLVVIVSEIALISAVATLPYALKANGGVWTLFTVQSPGVFFATALAAIMASKATCAKEKSTYRLVCVSGSLLSSAMVLSLVECLYGFEYGYLDNFLGFPWLHIAIHIFEQVGIYIFGVGVAALQVLLLDPSSFPDAEVRYVAGFLVYLYCSKPCRQPKIVTETESLSRSKQTDQLDEAKAEVTETPPVKPDSGADVRCRAQLAVPQSSVQQRRRTQSPGISHLVQKAATENK